MKQWFQKIFILFLCIIVLNTLLNILANNPYAYGFIHNFISKKSKEFNGLNFKIEAMQFNFIWQEVNFFGLEIEDQSKKISLKVDHVKANISLLSIFLDEFKIKNLIIDTLNLKITTDQQLDSSALEKTKIPNLVVQWPVYYVPIEFLSFYNSNIEIVTIAKNPKDSFSFYLNNFEGSFQFKDLHNIPLELYAKNFTILNENIPLLKNSSLTLKASINDFGLSSEEFKINSSETTLAGEISLVIQKEINQKYIRGLSLIVKTDVEADFKILGDFLKLKNTSGILTGKTNVFSYIPINDKFDSTFNIQGNVEVKNGKLDGFLLHDTKAEFSIDSEGLTLEQFSTFSNKELLARGKGFLAFNKALDFKFSAAFQDTKLSQIMEILKSDFKTIDATLNTELVEVVGQGEPFELSVNANKIFTKNISFEKFKKTNDSPKCLLGLNLKINDKKIHYNRIGGLCKEHTSDLKTLLLKTPQLPTNISFNGETLLDKDSTFFKINLIDFPLEFISNYINLPVSGLGNATANLDVRQKFLASVNLKSKNITAWGIENLSLDGDFSFDDQNLYLTRLNANDHREFDFNLKNSSISLKNLNYDMKIFAKNIPKESIKKIKHHYALNLDVLFGVNYMDMDIKGNLEQETISFIDSVMDLKELEYKKEFLASSVKTNFSTSTKGLFLENCTFNLHSIKGNCGLSITKNHEKNEKIISKIFGLKSLDRFVFKLQTEKGSPLPEDLRKFPFLGETFYRAGITGILAFDLKLDGNLKKFQGTLASSFKNLKINGIEIPGFKIDGIFNDFRTSFDIIQRGDDVRGRLTVDLADKDLPYRGIFNFNQFDARFLLGESFAKDPSNFSLVSANLQMEGQLTNLWKSTGKLKVTDLSLYYNALNKKENKFISLIAKEDFQFIIHDQNFKLDKKDFLNFETNFGPIRIVFKKMFLPNEINLHIESKTNLSILRDLTPEIQYAKGNLYTTTEIFGPFNNLKIKSQISTNPKQKIISNTSILIPKLGSEFKNINIDILYEDDVFKINDFRVRKSDGEIKAIGSFGRKNQNWFSFVNLSLKDANFIYELPILKTFDVLASGNLALFGDQFPWKLEGDISIDKARSIQKIDVRKEIILSSQKNQIAVVSDLVEQTKIKYNVNLVADKTIAIAHEDLQLNASTNLVLTGSDTKPGLTGQININQGKFLYLRNFVIDKGSIVFDNPLQFDPYIDIAAHSFIKPYNLSILLNGKLSNYSFNILVDPPTKDDGSIISSLQALVLLKKGSLPQNEASEIGSLGLSEAINTLATQVPFEKLQDLTRQNQVKFQIDSTVDDKGYPQPRANIQIDTLKDVDTRISSTTDKTQIMIEYPINESISISGQQTQNKQTEELQGHRVNQTDVDLRFKFSFD